MIPFVEIKKSELSFTKVWVWTFHKFNIHCIKSLFIWFVSFSEGYFQGFFSMSYKKNSADQDQIQIQTSSFGTKGLNK